MAGKNLQYKLCKVYGYWIQRPDRTLPGSPTTLRVFVPQNSAERSGKSYGTGTDATAMPQPNRTAGQPDDCKTCVVLYCTGCVLFGWGGDKQTVLFGFAACFLGAPTRQAASLQWWTPPGGSDEEPVVGSRSNGDDMHFGGTLTSLLLGSPVPPWLGINHLAA